MTEGGGNLRRQSSETARVTNVELFFDLVYVFAVTQLSGFLRAHQNPAGALQTALLFMMVWLVWVYTTWLTNWLDPERKPVRLLLLALMPASLLMSVALPAAFGTRGLAVGVSYAVMQIGRSVFAVMALRGDRLRANFERILAWCVVSGTLAVAGGVAADKARVALWAAAVGVDVLGGLVGFWTPRLGRSVTTDWTIAGGHFAERCQAFLLIALGESILVIGSTLSRLAHIGAPAVGAFAAAFVGALALWWVYFDRSAEEGARMVAASSDPGRLGQTAYHLIHPIMVAGVIVVAAADERVLSGPGIVGHAPTAWLVLGGTGLFLAGHAAFKATVWHVVPWSRLAAIVTLAAVGTAAPYLSALALSIIAAAVTLVVVGADQVGRAEREVTT
jgi:low temperature requirement protein LtrA